MPTVLRWGPYRARACWLHDMTVAVMPGFRSMKSAILSAILRLTVTRC